MRIEGRPPEEIAKELEVEKRTVYLWFSDPRIKAELVGQVDRVNELFAERLAGAGLKALEALCEMASQPTHGDLAPETKLKALREVLDRAMAARQSPQARSLVAGCRFRRQERASAPGRSAPGQRAGRPIRPSYGYLSEATGGLPSGFSVFLNI